MGGDALRIVRRTRIRASNAQCLIIRAGIWNTLRAAATIVAVRTFYVGDKSALLYCSACKIRIAGTFLCAGVIAFIVSEMLIYHTDAGAIGRAVGRFGRAVSVAVASHTVTGIASAAI